MLFQYNKFTKRSNFSEISFWLDPFCLTKFNYRLNTFVILCNRICRIVLIPHDVLIYRTLSVKKVKHLGGKFGDNVCEVLRISKMGELQRFSEKELQAKFDEKNG